MKKILQILIISVSCAFFLQPSGLLANGVDVDCDGVDDSVDNCPQDSNPSQTDWDKDGIGDVCDSSGCPKADGWIAGESCGCIETQRYMTDPWKFLRETANDPIATQAKRIVARLEIVQKGSGFSQSYRGLGYFWYYSNKLKMWVYIMPWNGVMKIWNPLNWANNADGTVKDVYLAQLGGGTDACGICSGDTSSCADCACMPNGSAVKDNCGVCGGDGSTCMMTPQCNGHSIEITRYMDQPTKLLNEKNSSDPAAKQAYNLVQYYRLVQKGLIVTTWGKNRGYEGMFWYYSEKIAETMPGNMAWFYLNPMSGVLNWWEPTHQGGPENDTYIAQLGGGTDACGICEGYGSTCADCKGIPNGKAKKDACGVCGGDGSSCANKCEYYSVKRLKTNLPFGCAQRYLRSVIKLEEHASNSNNPIVNHLGRLDSGYVAYNPIKKNYGKGGWGNDMYHYQTVAMNQVQSKLMAYLRGKLCSIDKSVSACSTYLGTSLAAINEWYQFRASDWGKEYIFILDKQGNPIAKPTAEQQKSACLLYTVDEISKGSTDGCGCPISFEWSDGEIASKANSSIVEFPLGVDPKETWSEWRASSVNPLLVIANDKQSQVNSATQLFGTWTFGGRRMAMNSSKDVNYLREPSWNNGYEPLAILDQDADGQLAGAELAQLGLWFDHNQDGVSQSGEIKSLADVSVTKVFFLGSKLNSANGDLELEVGYERQIGNKSVIGKSFDWFPKVGESKSAVEAQLLAK